MEENCTVKPSVAELAGRFKGHALPMPTASEEKRPIRRIPPSSLNFQTKKDGESESEKPAIVSAHPPKGKLKNSPLFEKIQANLALSPTAPVLSPEVKLQATSFPSAGSTSPCGPLSPTLSPTLRVPEEEPVSFEQPLEAATTLPSINKCRARLSFKRRPPTRQHRKSASEDPGFSPTDEPNGDGADVFDGPAEGRASPQPSVVKETSEEGEEGTKDAAETQEKAAPAGQDADQEAPVQAQAEEQQQQEQQEQKELDPAEMVMEESQQVEQGAALTLEN